MKFSRDFKEALLRDEYPQEWVDSAISYKKLKKCIKRVQEELQGLGLDPATLDHLWQQGALTPGDGQHDQLIDRGMNYEFLSDGNIKFTPKLTIALDPRDGSPMDAWLSPDTRRILRKYGRRQSKVTEIVNGEEQTEESSDDQGIGTNIDDAELDLLVDGEANHEAIETVEVPLTSDAEFFQILRRELSHLQELQETEQQQLESQIVSLGESLRVLQEGKKKKRATKDEIEAWREIFKLYTDAEVFFSSHEIDAGKRSAAQAQQQLTLFSKSLRSVGSSGKKIKLSAEGAAALEIFVRINIDLLKLLKYQEINRVALTKIMKKFDKRTALHAQEGALMQMNRTSFIAQDLAKATCFTISDELLKVIPQLDDYLCPICFSISWKPIRLRCGHIFCIRCLIVMQKANQDNCPLCREPVVLEASADNLDAELMQFLKTNFREEVKDKQRQNEIAAGIDAFGPGYTGTHRCVVM